MVIRKRHWSAFCQPMVNGVEKKLSISAESISAEKSTFEIFMLRPSLMACGSVSITAKRKSRSAAVLTNSKIVIRLNLLQNANQTFLVSKYEAIKVLFYKCTDLAAISSDIFNLCFSFR